MKKMDKSVKVLIVMSVITIVLFGLNTYIKKSNKIDYSDKEYIEINNDNIPSVYKLIGNKKIIKTTTGTDSKGMYVELVYSDLSQEEVIDYLSEFRNDDYVLISSDKNSAIIANESKESGKVITITASYSEKKTTIKYSKGNGTLTRD